MRINTNISSMIAIENGTANSINSTKSLEKLSSGLRINKASDDASGLAIADKLRTQKNSLIQSADNANSAIALLQITDRAMGEQSNILDIVKSKLLQARTATTSDAGRESIAKDINKLLTQFNSIANQTNYNGVQLLQQSKDSQDKASKLDFQIGETSTDIISTSNAIQANTNGLGIQDNGITKLGTVLTATAGDGSLLTSDRAATYLPVIDDSITDLNTMRSDTGSTQSQIESSLRNILTATTNIAAAESVIRDVDYAQETANFNKHSIIGNAATYAQTQANALPDDVLKLLN